MGSCWGLVALVVAVLLWYGPWLLAPVVYMGGDVLTEFYPWLDYATTQLRAGALPFWGPYSMAGQPLLANPQVGILYPPNWPLLAMLPVGRALNYSAVLHVGLAITATYCLARRWGLTPAGGLFAATSYGFNGLFAARLWAGNLNLVQVAAWLPVFLVAADALRAGPTWRAVLGMSGALWASALAGFYQLWFLGLLAAGAYLAAMPGPLVRRLWRLAALALAVLLALALAAPQLVPAYELVRWSTRAERLDWHFATDASLPLWHLPSLALPELFGSGAGTYWPGAWWHWHELTAYAGLLALALLPLGLHAPREAWVRYCAGLAALCLLLALGRYTPLYSWFYDWVPGYGSFRDPTRHLVLASLGVALVAGRGAERLVAGRGRGPMVLVLLALVASGALVATGLALTGDRLALGVVPVLREWGIWPRRVELAGHADGELGALVVALAVRATGLAVVAAALALAAVTLARRLRPVLAGLLLAGALFVDLTLFGWRYVNTPQSLAGEVPFAAPAEQFAQFLGGPALGELGQLPGPWRVAVLGRDSVVVGNAGYVLGLPLVIGLDPLLPRRYAALVAQIDGRPPTAFQHVALYLEGNPSPLWPLLNAPYQLVPGGDEARGSIGRFSVREDGAALPRAFAVTEVREVRDEGSSLAALAAPDFDPRAVVAVETAGRALASSLPRSVGAGDPVELGQGVASAVVQRYTPGDVLVAADLPEAGALVLLEAWHPGWTAMADGAPVHVYPADHAFMAVLLPAGRHEVRFQFAPRSWPLGLAVAGSAAGVVGLATGALWVRRVRRRSSTAPE